MTSTNWCASRSSATAISPVAAVRGGNRKAPSKIRWDLLERRIASSEKAYQRQIIRKKIDELVQYYEQCRQARDLPSIPGAVIISCDEKLSFEAIESGSSLGRLKVPEREGILRAIDGQHRLLALHADIENFADEQFTVPAIIFDRLPEDHVVQMFVTINAKHTRLNASHLVSLSGRQLYRDEALAAAHDVVRALNDREDSPLHNEIKLLGVGKGRVAQAPLAQEFKRLFADEEALGGAAQGRPVPRRLQDLLRQLLEAGVVGLRNGLARPQVQHPVGRPRCAPSSGSPRMSCGRSSSSTPNAPTSGPSAGRLPPGAGASAPSASRPTGPGSARARPWTGWRRSCAWPCSIRKAPGNRPAGPAAPASSRRRSRIDRQISRSIAEIDRSSGQ